MSKVTKLKVKQPDGNFSADIDLGAKAANITLEAGSDLETKLGEIDSSIAAINSAGYITKEVNDLTNYTTTENLETNYTKKTEFEGYKTTTDNRLDTVESKISSVYRPMGSVSTFSELEDKKSTAEIGDVWNVLDSGKNYAWTSESEWDDLGGTVDLTNYYTKNEVYNKGEVDSQIEGVVSGDLVGYLKTEDAEKTYAKTTALAGYETTAHATETYATKKEIPSLDGYMTTVAADAKYLDKETAGTTYATKEEIPSLEGYLTEEKAGQTYATQTALTTLDTNAVKVSGNQNIAGTKTFTSIPVLPTADPTLDTQATSKGYVDKSIKTATPNVGKLVTNATEAQEASEGESFGNNITLHKIAKTGSYNDLNDKPVIPSAVTVENSLTSTSTTNALSANQGKILNEKIPTAVSKLTNDAHYAKVEKADSEADALAKSKSNPDILYYWV